MSSVSSDVQAELIINLVKPNGRVWLLPDGDKAGKRLGELLLTQVAPHRFARWLRLGEGEQPTDLAKDDLKSLLTL
jgi:DNA primase